jgi:hypothetical protein
MVNVFAESLPPSGMPPLPWGDELPDTRIEARLYPLSGRMLRVTSSPASAVFLPLTLPFTEGVIVIAYSFTCVSEGSSGDGQAAISGTRARTPSNAAIFVIFFIFPPEK